MEQSNDGAPIASDGSDGSVLPFDREPSSQCHQRELCQIHSCGQHKDENTKLNAKSKTAMPILLTNHNVDKH